MASTRLRRHGLKVVAGDLVKVYTESDVSDDATSQETQSEHPLTGQQWSIHVRTKVAYSCTNSETRHFPH